MSTISSTQSDPLSQYRLDSGSSTSTEDSNELGRNQFLELMIAQLENQSPLDPQDNGAFISQLAEFSALEEMQNLSSTVESFSTQFRSTQALQASAMVGRAVLAEASEAPLQSDGTIPGVVDLPSSTGSLTVTVFNGSGELVDRIELGQQAAGMIPFQWDGTNLEGEEMPFDTYTLVAESTNGGETESVTTMLAANVNSVSVSQTGEITLNLQNIGAVSLDSVREII